MVNRQWLKYTDTVNTKLFAMPSDIELYTAYYAFEWL